MTEASACWFICPYDGVFERRKGGSWGAHVRANLECRELHGLAPVGLRDVRVFPLVRVAKC